MRCDGEARPGAAAKIRLASVAGFASTDRRFGGVFAQRIVDPVLVVLTHVITDQAAQMLLIQRDDMIEHLPAPTSDPLALAHYLVAKGPAAALTLRWALVSCSPL